MQQRPRRSRDLHPISPLFLYLVAQALACAVPDDFHDDALAHNIAILVEHNASRYALERMSTVNLLPDFIAGPRTGLHRLRDNKDGVMGVGRGPVGIVLISSTETVDKCLLPRIGVGGIKIDDCRVNQDRK